MIFRLSYFKDYLGLGNKYIKLSTIFYLSILRNKILLL